jgi:hypothetical protein
VPDSYRHSAGEWGPNCRKQEIILERSETELLVGGARGGGKTEVGLMWLVGPEDKPLIDNPRYRSLVIRRDYEDLSDWIFRAKLAYRGYGEVVGNPAEIRWRGGGVTRLGHWKDKATLSRYIGHEYWRMLFEELTQTVECLDDYKLLLGSLRCSEPGVEAQLYASTNPGGPGHAWVKAYWVDAARNKTVVDQKTGYSRIFIPVLAKDNPDISKQYLGFLDGLPDKVRAAWRDGSWESFEGQFFTLTDAHREQPWDITDTCTDRLYGSLDVGIGDYTSFGLYYLDTRDRAHRLFTYKANGKTHRDHAEAIRDRIETFQWTGGKFPKTVAAGKDAWNRRALRDEFASSAIDEYEDVFRGKGTAFVRANDDRKGGCGVFRDMLAVQDGLPGMVHWTRYNESYEIDMQAMSTDPNDPEVYVPCAGDDTADEARYGAVLLKSLVMRNRDSKAARARQAPDLVPFKTEEMVAPYKELLHEVNCA